jgi:Protein of unknown function (DUF2800).
MSLHAPFPPSAHDRWKICTGSFALGLQVPEPPESEYAAEGTRLHTVASNDLGAAHDEPCAPTADDAALLKPYLDYARKRMKQTKAVAIEATLKHSSWLFGTPDLKLIYKEAGEHILEIVDLKTGAGILVDPEENGQLLTYAYMALLEMAKMEWGQPSMATRKRFDEFADIRADQPDPFQFLPQTIRLTIVQPPDEDHPVKTWDTTREHVLEHGKASEKAIAIALSGKGKLIPGDHCRFCKAKPICPKLRGEVVEAVDGPLPATMSVDTLAFWLERADRMEGFIKAVREMGHEVASQALQQGRPGIPGWTLKPKRATRSWADEAKVLEIARKRRIKIWQDKLLSPAMAENEHPNLPQELRDQIVAVSSGTNLVRGNAPHAVTAPDASPMARLVANLNLKKF